MCGEMSSYGEVMSRDTSARTALVAAILVGIGAMVSSLASYLAIMAGLPSIPRSYLLQDPIGWALRPRTSVMVVIVMALTWVLLVGLTWVFVKMVARAALPQRAAAVFFGTWGALIIAAWIAGFVRAVATIAPLNYPDGHPEYLITQFFQIPLSGASWALFSGWLAALVTALVHRAAQRPPSPQFPAPHDGRSPW